MVKISQKIQSESIVKQYLTKEDAALPDEGRSEFINQQTKPMAGASDEHNVITGNLFALIWLYTRNKGYRVYQSDMRLHNPLTQSYCYPDIIVVKKPLAFQEHTKTDTLLNPVLLIEVLSDSTALYDRTEKFDAYASIPSLQEYILVSQDTYNIEQFYKNEQNQWIIGDKVREEEATFPFKSIDFNIAIKEVYADVEFKSVADDSIEENAKDEEKES